MVEEKKIEEDHNNDVAAADAAVNNGSTTENNVEKDSNSKPEKDGKTEKESAAKDKTPEEPPKEMRAVVLTSFGGLKSVKILKKPEPSLGADDVIIRVKACGLNFHDLMARQGVIESPKTPFILGFECSGDIEQIGENVTKFKVGDRVVALPEFKAWAELVAVPAKYVFTIPENMTYQDAAAITMNYIAAYILLFDVGGLTSGKSVLFHSAGGGVGHALTQLCKTVPDVKVFGVATKGKHEFLQNSGIDHLLERGSNYVNEVRKISEEGIDLVLDCLCGEECKLSYSLLKPMGRYVLYGTATVVSGETKSFFSAAKTRGPVMLKQWWQVEKISPTRLYDDNKTISGFNLRHLLYQQNGVEYVNSIFNKIVSLWTESKIKPVVDSQYALEDIGEAMQKMHDRKNIGKLILDPAMPPKPKPATPLKEKGKGKSIDKEEKEKEKEKKKDEEKEKEKEQPVTNGSSSPTADGKEKETNGN